MILGYHVIVSAYGFWLPNDPRGSWSWLVRKPELKTFGPATKVSTHRSVAGRPHDRTARLAAKKAIDFPPVRFDGYQAHDIAMGVKAYSKTSGVTVWACAVMPDHAHFVVARHRYGIEIVANLMKGAASKELLKHGRHPFAAHRDWRGDIPSCFARRWWVVYLDSDDDVTRTVEYVRRNPLKSGLPEQRWSFVVPSPERVAPKRPV